MAPSGGKFAGNIPIWAEFWPPADQEIGGVGEGDRNWVLHATGKIIFGFVMNFAE